jgi:hypothetical protein
MLMTDHGGLRKSAFVYFCLLVYSCVFSHDLFGSAPRLVLAPQNVLADLKVDATVSLPWLGQEAPLCRLL